MAYLGQVDADGLDPADYPVPNFSSLTNPAALAEAEMRLTASVVTYAHHASIGRVHWSRVSSDILYELKAPAPADVLASDRGRQGHRRPCWPAYEPQTPNYIALKAKLAELRGGKVEAGKAPIANGPAPKIGALDDRVPELRERFGLTGDGMTYDKPLADAVKKFQQEHELKVSGLLTPQTIDALNGRQPDRPIDTVIINLERWRWMPHDLGKNYVIVNLPDFTLRVFQNSQQVWMTRIVDGKPNMPTPIMTAEMKYITDQSDMERAALDRGPGIHAGVVAGPDRAVADGTQGVRPTRMAPCIFLSRRATPTRSAGCASTSPINSWSTSTTRRTRTFSHSTSARSAMAACGSRIR